MSNDQNNSNGQNNGGGISPMEMEKLNPSGDSDNNANINNNNNTTTAPVRSGVSSFLPDHPCDRLMLLIKLYFELYPRLMWGGCLVLFVLVIKWWSPWTSWYNAKYYQRNYMTRDYSNLQNDFNFKAAKIDHWCLFGGDDKCYCEDPMEGMPRSEILGWNDAHNRNKELVDLTVARTGGNIDVLFIGEQTVQSWNGVWLSKTAPEGPRIARYFNDTFNSPKAAFQGLALGIYGDRVSSEHALIWLIG